MDKPLISVLIPVYNQEKYIASCLDSVIDQTFSSYQILVLNDGSSDGTAKILEKYRDNNKVRLFYKENEKSIAKARNYLLDRIDTPYFIFVDSDDIVSPFYLEMLYSSLVKDNADISCCGYMLVNNFSKNKKNPIRPICMDRKDAIREMILGSRGQYILWNKLIKSELVKDIRFYDLSYGEDFCFIFKKKKKEVKVSFFQNRLYFYRFFVNRFSKEQIDNKKLNYLNKMIEMEQDEKYRLDKDILTTWIYITAEYYWLIAQPTSKYKKEMLDLMTPRRKTRFKMKLNLPKKFIKIIFGY